MDADISPLVKWVEAGTKPEKVELAAASPATRHYALFWDDLKVHCGILYREFHKKDGSDTVLQAMVPRALRKDVLYSLQRCHCGEVAIVEKSLSRRSRHRGEDAVAEKTPSR